MRLRLPCRLIALALIAGQLVGCASTWQFASDDSNASGVGKSSDGKPNDSQWQKAKADNPPVTFKPVPMTPAVIASDGTAAPSAAAIIEHAQSKTASAKKKQSPRSFDPQALQAALQTAEQSEAADEIGQPTLQVPSPPAPAAGTLAPSQRADQPAIPPVGPHGEIHTPEDYLRLLESGSEEIPPPGDQTVPQPGPPPAPTPPKSGLFPRPKPKPGDRRTSLHVNDLDVRKVFEMLGREHAMNILVSPNVKGTVTADLSNLTLEQTLDAILRSCSLAAKVDNGVIYIYTPEELSLHTEERDDDPINIRVFQLNYVRSTDLEKLVKPFLSPQGKMTATPASQVGIRQLSQQTTSGAGAGGGGSGGGSGGGAQSLTGGNSLPEYEAIIIQDHQTILQKVEKVIREIDVQPMQVMIEAVIMHVTHEKSADLGVNWGLAASSGDTVGILGNGAIINSASGFSPLTAVAAGAVRGATAFPDQGMKFGYTGTNGTAFIRALETCGKVEVLATPRLLVLNKQPAELQLGERLGYSTLSQSIVSTTQQIDFLDVGTLLRVRPFISTDGMVRMEVHPERSRGSIVDGIPQASTQEVTTNVLVPDGATLVIGGLMDKEVEMRQSGLPWLSRMPVVGAIFRLRQTRTVKKELIVLLTTRIWDPHLGPTLDSCPPTETPVQSFSPLADPLLSTPPQ